MIENLQEWARQKAIEYVCPFSLKPDSPYEHGRVKELTAFLMRALSSNDVQDLICPLYRQRKGE